MTAPRLLLACGSRTWTDRARVAAMLAPFAPPEWLVMHGACPLRSVGGEIGSADMLVDEAALRLWHLLGASLLRRPADWDRHGRAAGPKTRGTGGARGSPFAPSWAILNPALAKLKQGGSIAEDGWAEYVPAYIGKMRVSYRANPEAWANLLALPRVVIACHCQPSAAATGWCHRFLLGQRILPAIGAVYEGELPPAPARQGRLPGLE